MRPRRRSLRRSSALCLSGSFRVCQPGEEESNRPTRPFHDGEQDKHQSGQQGRKGEQGSGGPHADPAGQAAVDERGDRLAAPAHATAHAAITAAWRFSSVTPAQSMSSDLVSAPAIRRPGCRRRTQRPHSARSTGRRRRDTIMASASPRRRIQPTECRSHRTLSGGIHRASRAGTDGCHRRGPDG